MSAKLTEGGEVGSGAAPRLNSYNNFVAIQLFSLSLIENLCVYLHNNELSL